MGVNWSINPNGWDGIFEVLKDEPELRTKVANFGVKFRLFQELKSSAFDGDSASTDAYYIFLKISLQYSALEALEQIVGRRSLVLEDKGLAQIFRDTMAWTPFKERLVQVVDAPKLKERIQQISDDRDCNDLRPVLEAVRHGFFHPGLTAQNSMLSSSADLRSYLLRLCDRAKVEIDSTFKAWADSIRDQNGADSGAEDDRDEVPQIAGGYSRQQIESKYKLTFTDNQWRILLAELEDEDEFTPEQVIDDVVGNLADYEQEYTEWEMRVKEAADNKPQD